MKILLETSSMAFLSGAPMYYYTLAKELIKSHEVIIASNWTTNGYYDDEGYKLRKYLEEAGVRCISFGENRDTFDIGIMSHTNYDIDKCKVSIAVIHSEYECERPIRDERFKAYVCIRPSILDHIVANYGIDEDICHVIYNGVDRERFNPSKKIKKTDGIYRYVIPCTIDALRQDFLNYIISMSCSDIEVNIVGLQCGAQLNEGRNVKIHKQTFDIENVMAKADCVAGILLGRVNLEAMSMGICSEIYNPITLSKTIYNLSERAFDERHNIINVAKKLLNCAA